MVAEGRGQVSDEQFQEEVRKALEEFGPRPSEGPWEEVRHRFLFAGGGFQLDDPGSLLDVLARTRKEMGGSPQLIHYMAVPPSAFGPLTEAIGAHGLAADSRVVYEKPFGTSLKSFQQLDRIAHETFEESQIYRIDHFLGKEATQNIHVIRRLLRVPEIRIFFRLGDAKDVRGDRRTDLTIAVVRDDSGLKRGRRGRGYAGVDRCATRCLIAGLPAG